MISLALLLLQTVQAPVLAFPEAGIDDTAAYQGYQTRFYRDSKGNTVQVYLEPRGSRVVNLWADAADESLGFTVRDAAGRPARLDWAGDSAVTRDSGAVRLLEYGLSVESPRAVLGWFLLGSMRVERDFQYSKAHLKPYTAPAYLVAEESTLVANIARLPAAERQRHLDLLGAGNLAALRARLRPSIRHTCAGASCVVRVDMTSLDGRNHLALELGTERAEALMRVEGRTVTVRSRGGKPVRLTVRIATDGASLTPLERDSIFSRPFLDFLARERAGPSDPARGLRLEREARSIELLSSREKLMAGLPNFATYFGRDMLMAALMMRSIWRPEMSEHVIASVLRKLSPRGDVSHEEALGGQAIRENGAEYSKLMAEYFRRAGPAVAVPDSAPGESCDTTPVLELDSIIPTPAVIPSPAFIPSEARDLGHHPGGSPRGPAPTSRSLASLGMKAGTPACLLTRARAILGNLQRTRENYHMLDDEFQLPILEARYLADTAVSAERKRAFLLAAEPGRPTRLALMLSELALVAAETHAYAADPRPQNLVSFVKRDSTHWRSASWRDSDAGYGNGRYAMDINAVWAPRALEAIASILAALPSIGIGRQQLDSLAQGAVRGPLARYLADSTLLQRAIETWHGARRHFAVTLSRAGVERDVAAKMRWLPPREQAYWRTVLTSHGEVRDSLAFLALSLDSAATPLAIVNTDPATEIFLDATSSRPVALDQLGAIMRPYPVGLFVERLGPLVANDAYAPRRVWDVFGKDQYHGPRVVWGREVNLLLLGLASAIARAPDPAASDALRRTQEAVRASGLEHSELWSYRIEGERLQPTRYGTGSDVQLWSSTDLAVQFMLSRLSRE